MPFKGAVTFAYGPSHRQDGISSRRVERACRITVRITRRRDRGLGLDEFEEPDHELVGKACSHLPFLG